MVKWHWERSAYMVCVTYVSGGRRSGIDLSKADRNLLRVLRGHESFRQRCHPLAILASGSAAGSDRGAVGAGGESCGGG